MIEDEMSEDLKRGFAAGYIIGRMGPTLAEILDELGKLCKEEFD